MLQKVSENWDFVRKKSGKGQEISLPVTRGNPGRAAGCGAAVCRAAGCGAAVCRAAVCGAAVCRTAVCGAAVCRAAVCRAAGCGAAVCVEQWGSCV